MRPIAVGSVAIGISAGVDEQLGRTSVDARNAIPRRWATRRSSCRGRVFGHVQNVWNVVLGQIRVDVALPKEQKEAYYAFS